jgi:hypothetical protein
MSLGRTNAAPIVAPLVISPACLVGPVEAAPVEEPPVPDAIERPAGQPSAQNYPAWLTYEARRRERAELYGLFFQGQRDALQSAWEMNADTQTRCRDWARSQDQ